MPKPDAYGIRIRKDASKKFRRYRDFKHPRGRWSNRGVAQRKLDELRRQGWKGHVFGINDPAHYPTATHYSKNFTRAELECRGPECDGVAPPHHVVINLTELASHLEVMREELGHGIGIKSGYRCHTHNKNVHGASLSRHKQGDAADLAVPPGKQKVYKNAAEQVPAFNNGGIGVYPNGGLHVDHRGYRARWDDWVRT